MASVRIKSSQYELEEVLNGMAKLSTPDLEKFLDEISYLLAKKKAPNPSERELILIAKIYDGLTSKTQKRYNELTDKVNEETITDKEHKEYLKLIDKAEKHNVDYLATLTELAQLRKIPIQKLIKQLGIDKL